MALSRRQLLRLVPATAITLALGASGCAPGATSARSRSPSPYAELHRVTRAGSKGTVAVFMPDTAQTKEVWTGLSDELGRELDLVAVRFDADSDPSVFERVIGEYKPSAIVLVNNPTVAAYRDYQRRCAPGTTFAPAVIVMASFLGTVQKDVSTSTGIHYEVPLITVVTNLRKLIATRIERIGVIRRAVLAPFVAEQARLAAREGIRVVEEVVGPAPNASELKRALRRVRGQADALWVLNDNQLLTPRLIADAWLPGVSERPWIPTIVGAGSLVSTAQSFGTFAMLPDHTALGGQAAAMLFDLAENDFRLDEDARTKLPLSTTTTVDYVQAVERFALRADALTQVDHILR